MVRRLIRFGVLVATALSVVAGQALAGPTLLLDLQTGKVLEENEATRPWYPASLSKLMTAYTVFKAIEAGRMDLGTPVAISRRASRMAPSKMGYPVGTRVTVDNALKMLIVPSANDIAIALAEGTSGSVEAFAAEMNGWSRRLGMRQSSWVNPNGLPDPQQVSSARDLALVSMAILREFPHYAPYFSIQVIQSGERTLRSHNAMLYRYPGTTGMKTGFICAGGFNVVANVHRNGRNLLAVVLGAPTAKVRTKITADLIEQNYDNAGGGLFRRGKTLAQLAPSPYATPTDIRAIACGRNKGDTTAEDGSADPAAAETGPLLTAWTLDTPVQVGPYTGPRPAANTVPPEDFVAETKPAPRAKAGKGRAGAKAARKPAAKPRPAKAKTKTGAASH